MELTQLPILVEHPRCPFCHDAVGPADDATPCLTCRSWQHTDCAAEGAGRCGACRALADRPPIRVVGASRRDVVRAARAQAWSIALWVAAWSVIFVAQAILPAFERMFREVGCSLPPITVFTLGPGRWVWAVVVLSLLHGALLLRDPVWRSRSEAGAVAAIVLGGAVGVVGLFSPLIETCQKL